MLGNIKLGVKLIGGFVIVAIVAAFIGYLGLTNIKKIAQNEKTSYEKSTVPLSYLIYVTDYFENVRILSLKTVLSKSVEERSAYNDSIKEYSAKISDLLSKYEKTFINEEDKKLYEQFVEVRKAYLVQLNRILDYAKYEQIDEAMNVINNEAKDAAANYQKVLDEIIKVKIDKAKQMSESDEISSNNSIRNMIFVGISGFLIAILLGLFLTISITGPLKKVTNLSNKMADGDLSMGDIIVKSKDEIGILATSFNKMLGSLNELLSQVNASIEQVGVGANQVAEASQSLSQGATEQASSLEEITSSITQINGQTRQNADNAVNANALAKKSMNNAEDGNKQMSELVDSMQAINKSSDEIKKVVKVIDDIAFQINLLALNANVEAARAGKYGKGFAVVADEVRNLAVKSAKAVKETTQMVEESISNIKNGVNLVDVTAKQLEEIVNGASKVVDLVDEIASASREQSQGLEQINIALGQIDQVTQSNTANAEESASSAEELAGQSTQLRGMIRKFKLRGKNEITTNILNGLSPELLESLIREKLSKKNEHHFDNKKNETKIINTNPKMIENKKIVNPKDIINLDDNDFEKF